MTLQQLQKHMEALAALAGLGKEDLPTFGSSADNARPHIEVMDGVYYYVICERGAELDRRLFGEEQELHDHALEGATSQVASDREVAARRDELGDSRRERFRIQQELMTRIKPEWGARLESEHATLTAQQREQS